MSTPNQLEILFQPPPTAEVLKRYEGCDPELVLLDEKEAAIITEQAPKTLESLAEPGENLRFLKLGRRVRYRLSDVLEFLNRNTFRSTREARSRDRAAPDVPSERRARG